MKLGTKPKPAPKIVIEAPDLGPKAERLEEQLTRLSGELSELELRSRTLSSLTDEAIRKRAATFVDMLDRRMDEVERRIIYSILDFLENCPAWEILKIDEAEHNRKDAAATFSKALRDGWRYLGNYMNPAVSVPKERYTLMIRPKGGPFTDLQYLKFYEDFKDRRDAEKKKPILSKPAVKVATKPSVTKNPKPPVQLKSNKTK